MGRVFRPATHGDVPALTALAGELGYPSTAPEVAARLERLLERPEHRVLVAEEDGTVLGWLHVQESHSLASDPCALVVGMVVTARARRTGLGSALLARAEDWARKRELGAIRLRSRVEREDAHEFYRKLGYRETKRQVQFRKEL